MASCRNCGLSISETATFCTVCGTPVAAGPTPDQAARPGWSTGYAPAGYAPPTAAYAPLTAAYAPPAAAAAMPRGPAPRPAPLMTRLADPNARIWLIVAAVMVVLACVVIVGTGHTIALSLVIFTVVDFACMVACLYVATLLVGYKITVKQIIAVAVICSIIGTVPLIGWLLALVVGFSLLMSFTGAEWVDTVIILVVNFVLRVALMFVLLAVFGLQFALLRR